MTTSDAIIAGSFMKQARAHYRMRGGKVFGAMLLILLLALIALVLKADNAYFGVVSPKRTMMLVLLGLATLKVR